ncbi:MAG: FAD:protein FMN transferase [Rubripirellula sp.]
MTEEQAEDDHENSPDEPSSEPGGLQAVGAGRDDSSLLTHVTRRAMATEFVVILPERWSHAVEIAFQTMEQLDQIENALTIYREDSEISALNREASDRPVRLSQPTFELLQRAILWSERTEGAFDVTAGPLVEAWGFTRRSGRKPTEHEVESALQKVGYQHLVLNEADQTVRFDKPAMAINLGAIGKGDALDRIAEGLQDQGVTDFLIHGGNSSVLAAGDQHIGSGQGWPVGVAHPTKPKRRLAGLWLRDQSLATSGSGKQFFHHRGKRYGHVIDPRTGYPAGDLMSLTVLTKSAADADACATGLFVTGREHIARVSQANDWSPDMVLVRQGERQDQVDIETHGDVAWVEELS